MARRLGPSASPGGWGWKARCVHGAGSTSNPLTATGRRKARKRVLTPFLVGGVDAGLAGYKTRHQLGLLYQEQGRNDLAEAQWRLALAERPDFSPAGVSLAQLAKR
jgi:hypothetical protein